MCNYVRPNVELTALRWLKVNNPLYANVIINNNWLSDSARDDNKIFVGLFNTSIDNIDTGNTNDSTCTNDVDMIDQCNEVDTTVVINNGTLRSENNDAMDVDTSYIDLVCLAREHGLAIHPFSSWLSHSTGHSGHVQILNTPIYDERAPFVMSCTCVIIAMAEKPEERPQFCLLGRTRPT